MAALDDADEGVRRTALQFLEAWLDEYNKTQTPPSVAQRQRVEALLETAAPRLPAKTSELLRFMVKSL
jgi:hypothetical protein